MMQARNDSRMTDDPRSQEARLAASARTAWDIAPRTCRVDPATGASCAAAHGAWPSLRLLGIVGTIEYRSGFYVNALAALTPRQGALRVLISGAADHAMLGYVVAALGDRQGEIAVTVLDLCETPLEVNRRWAERAAHRIETVCCDVLKYEPSAPFDAICTDSFLGRFPAVARPALARKWHALLRPGGRVVTANALRPASAPERIVFSPEQAQALGEATLRAAENTSLALPAAPAELARSAEAYARQHLTHAVRSAEEVRELFVDAGFAVDRLDTLRVAAAAAGNPAAPSVKKRNAEYLTVVAARV